MALCCVCSADSGIFELCKNHYKLRKDFEGTEWFKALRNFYQQDRRRAKKDMGHLVSMDWLEEIIENGDLYKNKQ